MASLLLQTLDGKMVSSLAASGFIFIQTVAKTMNELSREFSSCPNDCQRLLVFDGPLDMDWVENFNTLLDQNQVAIIITGIINVLHTSSPPSLICCRCFALSLVSARLSAQGYELSLNRPVLQTFHLQLCPVVLW